MFFTMASHVKGKLWSLAKIYESHKESWLPMLENKDQEIPNQVLWDWVREYHEEDGADIMYKTMQEQGTKSKEFRLNLHDSLSCT